MNKPVFAMLLGAFLGFFDGLSALLHGPEIKPMIWGILAGSTLKGLVAGLIIGFVAQRTQFLLRAVDGGSLVFSQLGHAAIVPGGRGDAVVLGQVHRRRRRASRKPASAARPTAVAGLLRTNSRASSPICSTLFWSSAVAVSCSLREALRA